MGMMQSPKWADQWFVIIPAKELHLSPEKAGNHLLLLKPLSTGLCQEVHGLLVPHCRCFEVNPTSQQGENKWLRPDCDWFNEDLSLCLLPLLYQYANCY